MIHSITLRSESDRGPEWIQIDIQAETDEDSHALKAAMDLTTLTGVFQMILMGMYLQALTKRSV